MSLITLFAATGKIDPGSVGVQKVQAGNLVSHFLVPVYTWAGILCVIIIIVAGYFYVISAGNASTVKRAKDAILGAVIGLVVIMSAFIITQFVAGRF